MLGRRHGFARGPGWVVAGVRLGSVLLAACGLGGCILRPPRAKLESHAESRPLPVATRFARLTHAQWANTLRDLLSVDATLELEGSLRPDPTPSGFLFDNYAASQSVDAALWLDYQRLAAKIADDVTRDPLRLARIVPPPGADTAARARGFVESFGRLVHRRPLTNEQVEQYLVVFQAGRLSYPGMGELESGVRLVLEAMLQSPLFLYRSMGVAGTPGERARLDAHDLAARLSYTLWNTLPDAELFDQAATGELADPLVLARVAERMLADPRSEAVISSFHAQLFDRERLKRAAPSRQRFGDISEKFVEHAARESELFINYQVLERNAGYAELMSASESFVNAELASVYGLEGAFGNDFAKVSFDPARRRGLLTQVAFLASHATSVDPDPIHRGVFVARRLLCKPLTAPGNLPPLPAANGRTNRQTVEAHTQAAGSGCAVCHERTINPLGFPFEMYDAIGRLRTLDNGEPVDPSTVATLDGEKVNVKDGVELAELIAHSPTAHECYARHWLEYAYGRPATERDEAFVKQLGDESVEGKLSVKGLIVKLIRAPQFSTLDERDL